jgi:uncharacterized protein (DUF2267 family)
MSNWKTIPHTTETSMRWVHALQAELGGDEQRAWHALRAVLHTLRDRLVVGEAADLGAQLPLLIRGLYYDGWRPGRPTAIRSADAFRAAVAARLDGRFVAPGEACRAVFRVLERFVTEGEIRQVYEQLPKDVRDLWPVTAEV